MMKKYKKQYQTPNLKVVSFEVESGFAGSSNPSQPGLMSLSPENANTNGAANGANWQQGSTAGWF